MRHSTHNKIPFILYPCPHVKRLEAHALGHVGPLISPFRMGSINGICCRKLAFEKSTVWVLDMEKAGREGKGTRVWQGITIAYRAVRPASRCIPLLNCNRSWSRGLVQIYVVKFKSVAQYNFDFIFSMDFICTKALVGRGRILLGPQESSINHLPGPVRYTYNYIANEWSASWNTFSSCNLENVAKCLGPIVLLCKGEFCVPTTPQRLLVALDVAFGHMNLHFCEAAMLLQHLLQFFFLAGQPNNIVNIVWEHTCSESIYIIFSTYYITYKLYIFMYAQYVSMPPKNFPHWSSTCP